MIFCLTLSGVDWALTRDVVSILGTVSTIVLAAIGLTTWRRQLQGTSEYALATNALHLAYEVQQLLQEVRSPMLFLRKEEVEAGNRIQEEQNIYGERMNAVHMKWAELQTIRLKARVIWQAPAHHCFEGLHKIIAEIRAAIWYHFWLKGAYGGPGAEIDRNPERLQENNEIIYRMAEDDAFSKKIDAAVSQVEEFFSAKVRRTWLSRQPH
ncbi:hypothetical protein GTP55_13160 [Duganella sp. FT109W]|uniref:SLATT domain-containing protein n=1 Tax=Duganella margarita TaxID=2692170 RepID=A0ABW9WJQ7_9BURK|nr:hypothetical protein [Duganella margarita]MYN40325.1 hypothetical protein [Duganella margarita]